MVGEVRHPAGDPALSEPRRRQARPAPRHHVLDPRRSRRAGTTRRRYGGCAPTAATRSLPLRRDGHRLPVDAQGSPRSTGVDQFAGEVYFTSRWPHDGVDFTGKRVAVIGTGSSGIQSIPLIAAAGAPAGGVPAHPELLDPGAQRSDVAGAARAAGRRRGGLPRRRRECPAAASRWSAASPRHSASRRPNADSATSALWETGELFESLNVYADVMSNPAANDELRRVLPRTRSAAIVDDPQTAADAVPDRLPGRRRSGRAWTPTTSPPTTCRTCAWSTSESIRSDRSPRPASTPPTSRSSSTRSCSPPASTP